MDTRGSKLPTNNERLAAFQTQIREMRRDLKDTLTLITKLRKNCLSIEARLLIAEQEYAVLLTTPERYGGPSRTASSAARAGVAVNARTGGQTSR